MCDMFSKLQDIFVVNGKYFDMITCLDYLLDDKEYNNINVENDLMMSQFYLEFASQLSKELGISLYYSNLNDETLLINF